MIVLLESPPADEAAGEGYERIVKFGAALPSHGEPLELVEQGEGLLNDVAELVHALHVRGALAGDDRQDPVLAELLAVGGGLAAFVAEQGLGPSAWSAGAAGDGRDLLRALRDTTVQRKQPLRVIVADARRHHVPVLTVDINTSRPQYTVEKTGTGWGVRISLASVKGISEDEVARIAAGQPYTGLQDFYARAHPKLPTVERLIQIGALDTVKGEASRRDLLLQAIELHRHTRTRPGAGQLPLDATLITAGPSGLREMTAREQLEAELGVLKIDVSRHLMGDHHRLLREIGATDAAHLRAMHPGQKVLVAGVRASTQTPPIASGKRIIFVTLEDGTGVVDLAFFEDTHEVCAHTVFHHGLLLVRGTVEARGPRRTVVGEMAWDLDALATERATHGPQAVLDLLGQAPAPTPAQPTRTIADGTAGARLHPYADLQPAGTRSADLTHLGHRSQGSAG